MVNNDGIFAIVRFEMYFCPYQINSIPKPKTMKNRFIRIASIISVLAFPCNTFAQRSPGAEVVTEVWSSDKFYEALGSMDGFLAEKMHDFAVVGEDEFLMSYVSLESDALGHKLRLIKHEADGTWKTSTPEINADGFELPDLTADNLWFVNDSEGNIVMLTSYIGSDAYGQYDINVMALERDAGTFRIVSQSILSFPDEDYFKADFPEEAYNICSPAIEGDVKSGNFTLTAFVWGFEGTSLEQRHSIIQWTVTGGRTDYCSYDVNIRASLATVQALGHNQFLTDDKNIIAAYQSQGGGYTFSAPTVITFDNLGNMQRVNGVTEISDNNFGTGSTIFAIESQYYFFSTDTEELAEETMIKAPSFARAPLAHTFTLERLGSADMADEKAFRYRYLLWSSQPGKYGVEDFRKGVAGSVYEEVPMVYSHAVTDASGNVNLYVRSGQNHMTKFRIDKDTVTALGAVFATDDSPAEYFTLTGIRVAAPASAGIYIERRGTCVRKITVR